MRTLQNNRPDGFVSLAKGNKFGYYFFIYLFFITGLIQADSFPQNLFNIFPHL